MPGYKHEKRFYHRCSDGGCIGVGHIFYKSPIAELRKACPG
jgi:hypothetical protein